MKNTVRTNLTMKKTTHEFLVAESKRMGVSINAVILFAIDEYKVSRGEGLRASEVAKGE